MRRTTSLAGTLVLLIGALATGLSAGSAAADTGSLPAVSRPAASIRPVAWSLSAPLTRERVGPGARDRGPHHIAHVREVQLRLTRLGTYRGRINGVFDAATTTAVETFQRNHRLPVTGVVDAAAWRLLITRTTFGVAPRACRRGGWHMCVDRKRHQASLFHDGRLYNSWLIRTGGRSTKSRVGTWPVYWRDINHVSSIFGDPMPYAQFYSGGEALHGSVHMTNPFRGHSHGCVNFYLEDARQLWNLTHTVHLSVAVYGAWD